MDANNISGTTRQDLITQCLALESNLLYGQSLTPINWGAVDSDALFPIPESWTWDSLSSIIENNDHPSVIVCYFPAIWQLEQSVAKIAKKFHRPLIDVPENNLPLLEASLIDLRPELLIIDAHKMDDLVLLEQKIGRLPKTMIIHSHCNTIRSLPLANQLVNEIHLFPGVPLLYQTLDLTLRVDGWHFLLNPFLSIVTIENKTCVSGKSLGVVNLDKLELPFAINHHQASNTFRF